MSNIHMIFGGYQGPASVHTRGAQAFGEALEKRLGSDVSFELRENIVAEGRNAADLFDLVESGEFTYCYFSSSYSANRVPELGLLDLPYLIDDREAASGSSMPPGNSARR